MSDDELRVIAETPPSGPVQSMTLGEAIQRMWKPINSAPQDGADVLVWGGRLCIEIAGFAGTENGRRVWEMRDGQTYDEAWFTHWMPLPEPPPPSR